MSDQKKLVVITGASSGIGAEAAKEFSKLGHPLLLIARRIEKLEALNLPNTICKKVDVRDREMFINAVKEAEELYGKTDLLINNAGVMLLGDAAEQAPNEWDAMIDVNIKGLLNGVYAVLPSMKERKTGTIINVGSIAGRKTFPNHSVYCGTKFAVHAMTDNIRQEASASGVRVIVVAPGAVETELLSHNTPETIDGYNQWKENIGGALSVKYVVNSMVFAYQQPQSVCIREIVMAATGQDL
ncbi:MAG: SDR family oxidoreductase [Hyphomicrobiales bacterium]